MIRNTAMAVDIFALIAFLAILLAPPAHAEEASPPTPASSQPLPPPIPVSRVDLQRYVGTWYEIARIPHRFQNQCVRDVTAQYEIREDGRIRVVNSCVKADGSVSRANGVAKVVDTETNARLKVSFFSILGIRPVWGDYWILGLGDDYEYAVVGNPDRKYGWILARSPHPDPATLEKAWRVVEQQGYDRTKFVISAPDSIGG